MSPLQWVAAAALGGCGALARFWLDGTISARTRSLLPFGTLVVNLSGSLLLGLSVGLGLGTDSELLIGSATLGSFTTFSTWMLESQRLAEDGEAGHGLANLVLSLALGFVAAVLGRALGRLL